MAGMGFYIKNKHDKGIWGQFCGQINADRNLVFIFVF